MEAISRFFEAIDTYMYYPVLIIILALGGLYFTFRTQFVQIRLFGESCRLIMDKPSGDQKFLRFRH